MKSYKVTTNRVFRDETFEIRCNNLEILFQNRFLNYLQLLIVYNIYKFYL